MMGDRKGCGFHSFGCANPIYSIHPMKSYLDVQVWIGLLPLLSILFHLFQKLPNPYKTSTGATEIKVLASKKNANIDPECIQNVASKTRFQNSRCLLISSSQNPSKIESKFFKNRSKTIFLKKIEKMRLNNSRTAARRKVLRPGDGR